MMLVAYGKPKRQKCIVYVVCVLHQQRRELRILKKALFNHFHTKTICAIFFVQKILHKKIMHTFMCKKIGAFKIAQNILHNLSADAGITIVYQNQYNSTRN